MNKVDISWLKDRLQINRGKIASLFREIAPLIEHISDAATHPRREISAARAEHNDKAVGHVFASVVADAFHHRGRTRISNRESLAGHAVEKCFAAGRAIEHDVPDQNVLFRGETGLLRRINHKSAARETLAGVIVRIALECHSDALGQKCTETLSCRALEADANSVVRQAFGTVAARDLSAQHRTNRAMNVANRETHFDWLAVFQGSGCAGD